MAATRSIGRLDVVFDAGRTFIEQKMDQMRMARAKRRVYRATYHELSALTDRDLRDLDIPRSDIKRLAWEAAYDH